MKKQIFTLLSLLSVTFSFAQTCTPVPMNHGLTPASSAVTCIEQGEPFSQTYYFLFPTHTDNGTTITRATIDSVRGLPAGLTATFNRNPPVYSMGAGEQGCFVISGTTNAACGQYWVKIHVTLRALFNGQGVNFHQEIASHGIYAFQRNYLRVIEAGDTVCPTLNTAQTVTYAGYPVCGISGIDELTESSLLLYPNPAADKLTIDYSETLEQVSIYNVDGKLITETRQPENNTIDISGLAKGIYVAEVKVKDGVERVRWVKM